MSLAQEMAEALEEMRVELLGSDATIALRSESAGGTAPFLTISRAFYVKRKSNLTLGEEYLEARIAEQTGVTKAALRTLVEADYAGERWRASVIEMAINAARVFVLRLDATGTT